MASNSESETPGFAVTVLINDSVGYQQSFGQADFENNKAYTNQTTQPIGSISKTFVAAAIVKAIEQDLHSETAINDILPAEIINPQIPDAVIKVKHLVTHTSGLLDQLESYYQAYHILPGEDLSTPGAQLLLNSFGIQQGKQYLLKNSWQNTTSWMETFTVWRILLIMNQDQPGTLKHSYFALGLFN
ncbi:MAG: serine hydrolase domain-containing protein [Bacteroidia bacterium]